MATTTQIESDFNRASGQFQEWGIDVASALARLGRMSVSLQCWQGDDVQGFEPGTGVLGGGLAVTGNHPGRARTADELRSDLDRVLSLVPGRHRLNLHASYAEPSQPVDRDALEPAAFSRWRDWAQAGGIGIDFNPTYFSHPRAADGFTLGHRDGGVRDFWVAHGIACRNIGAWFGRELGSPCVTNFWVPDGFKDTPADRWSPRERLRESLDRIFAQPLDPAHNLDSVESKLFGIGSESYVVGSHEFYLGYAIRNRKLLCLDTGHYHPTESIADKLSSTLPWVEGILLHVSRGIRWDSDHVVTLTEDLRALAREVVRCHGRGNLHLGLDYFDASINRVAAWVIGVRSLQKALLCAMLEPEARYRAAEDAGDLTGRLALQEEARLLPYGAVWDFFCHRAGVPVGPQWLEEVRAYERKVLSVRT